MWEKIDKMLLCAITIRRLEHEHYECIMLQSVRVKVEDLERSIRGHFIKVSARVEEVQEE
jgi:hypothetical protein